MVLPDCCKQNEQKKISIEIEQLIRDLPEKDIQLFTTCYKDTVREMTEKKSKETKEVDEKKPKKRIYTFPIYISKYMVQSVKNIGRNLIDPLNYFTYFVNEAFSFEESFDFSFFLFIKIGFTINKINLKINNNFFIL